MSMIQVTIKKLKSFDFFCVRVWAGGLQNVEFVKDLW